MFDDLIARSSLPNLHPAVVHFPIALLVLAFVIDCVAVLGRRGRSVRLAAAILYVGGTAAAVLAWLSGRQASDSIGLLSAEAQLALAEHSDFAFGTVRVFAVVAAGRLAVELLQERLVEPTALVLRGVLLIASGFGLWLLISTADRGGSLVFVHGVGVRQGGGEAPASLSKRVGEQTGRDDVGAQVRTGSDSLVRTEEGGVVWQPGPGDVGALDDVIETIHSSQGARLRAVEEAARNGGLTLESHGTVFLLFPDARGDVLMESELDVSEFVGRIGLTHHFASESNYECMLLDRDGSTVLRDTREVLDQAELEWPFSPVRVAVSVAGSHLKGFIDGELITHGHRPEPENPGRVGLMLDGAGQIELFELRVSPAASGQ